MQTKRKILLAATAVMTLIAAIAVAPGSSIESPLHATVASGADTFDPAAAPATYAAVDYACLGACGVTSLNGDIGNGYPTLSAGDFFDGGLSLDSLDAYLAASDPGAGGRGAGMFATPSLGAPRALVGGHPDVLLLSNGAHSVEFSDLVGVTGDWTSNVQATLPLLEEPQGPVSVPEPGALGLLGLGLLGVGFTARRKQRKPLGAE